MKYKVGDKVRVRQWEDMKKEYGIDRDGDIATRPSFVRRMRKYCGKVLEIKEVEGDIYKLDDIGWDFSEKMFEPVCYNKIVITSDGKTTFAKLCEDIKVVKTAKAECSPDDTFDFATGAKLAFERLFAPEKAKAIVGATYKVIGNSIPHHGFLKGDLVTMMNASGSRCIHLFSRKKDSLLQYLNISDVELVEEPKKEPKLYSGKVVCVEAKEKSAYTVGKIYEFKDGKVKIDNGCWIGVTQKVNTLDDWNNEYPNLYHAKFIELKD
ncbi:MAG: hypothetical protein ACI4I1_06675 [Oscillospiraceae bacterium]